MTTFSTPQTRNRLQWGIAVTVLLGTLIAALLSGDLILTPVQVWNAITGHADSFTTTVVLSWRLPRALVAIVFGAALGAAGAIFQTLTRNPLGSPDIIGFNTGAYTGVLISLIILPAAGFVVLASAAVVGGLATAAAVLIFSASTGVGGRGFILTGIAVSALLTSLNTWLLYKTDIATATTGSIWAAGTLDNTRWQHATPALIVLIFAATITGMFSKKLRILALGDDLATALGLRVTADRVVLIICAVTLTAVTTAIAGPILFIALASPHLAKTLLPHGRPILAAGITGAILLSCADWIAAHAFAPTQIPVGAITVSLGGAYLVLTILFRKQ
ncbi:MAG: FecCD family ABC transporter permease [Leucobacter sp.]